MLIACEVGIRRAAGSEAYEDWRRTSTASVTGTRYTFMVVQNITKSVEVVKK